MEKAKSLSSIKEETYGILQIRIDLLFRQIEESPDADSALIPMALEEFGRLRDQLNDKQQKRLDNIIIKRDMYLETQAKTVQMN